MAVHTEPALLERESELGQLEAALEDARRGDGRLLVIEGSAGIGKTRLLGEARQAAGSAGMRVLAARGTELEREFPFALVRQLFEPALTAAEPSARDELLAGVAAPAGPVVGVEDATVEAPLTDLSFAALNALYWLTSNLSEAEPLLLVVDDVHWSDPPSLRFFRFLASRLEDLSALLLLAARPAEPGAQPELLSQLVADPLTTVIRPSQLSPPAVGELVRQELGPATQDEFCVACHEATGGNPFMLRELLVQLAGDGSRGTAAEAANVREAAPPTIRRAALLRLARLPDSASALARAVAVLGDAAAVSDAATLAGLDASVATQAADALAAAGIFEPAHPYRFVHPITRAAVYADLPSGTKASTHEQAAGILTARGADPERIAAHLLATDPVRDAARVETLSAAARRALDRAAPESAAAYLRRALAEPPAAALRLDLVRLLVRAYSRAGDQRGFEELAESGMFEELVADPETLLESADELAHILNRWGRAVQVKSLLERATEVAIEAGNRELVARFQTLLAFWRGLTPAEGLARLERFSDYVEPETAGGRLYLALQAFWSLCAGAPREIVAGLAKRAVADGKIWRENLDNPVPDMALYALRHTDELDFAERALAQQLSVVAPHGAWATTTQGFDRGELALLRGQVAEAEAELRVPIEVERQTGSPLFAPPLLLALLIETLVERDDLAGAEGELSASGIGGAMPDHWFFLPLRHARARLRLAEGKPHEALEDLLSLARTSAEVGMRPGFHAGMSHLALAHNGVGNHAEARQVAAQEVAGARAWGLSRRIGIALRTQGLIEGGEHGLELLRESVEVLEPSPYRLDLARCLGEYGAALRRANRRAEAREPLRGALEWARSTGALALARRAHEELEATGEKLRPLLAEGVESLTPSERRVADLAAEGKTNREIAQGLFLSVKTVETHLSHVYRKLDIESRRELAAALAG